MKRLLQVNFSSFKNFLSSTKSFRIFSCRPLASRTVQCLLFYIAIKRASHTQRLYSLFNFAIYLFMSMTTATLKVLQFIRFLMKCQYCLCHTANRLQPMDHKLVQINISRYHLSPKINIRLISDPRAMPLNKR